MEKTRICRCHTPKFDLLFLKTFHTSILKDSSRVDQTNFLLDNQPKLGFGNSQIQGVPNISNGHHTSSYASKNLHVKFQALQLKFSQTIAQMVENQLYWTKSQLWSTYSQISSFLVNIKILKSHSSFDQRLIMIHQENSRFIKSQKV